MNYSTPEGGAEIMEMQTSTYFTIFHSNKRDAAFRGGEDSWSPEQARAAFLDACKVIGGGRYWVEVKPKKLADKGTVTKFWMQIGKGQQSQQSNMPQSSGISPDVLALMKENQELNLKLIEQGYEFKEELRKIQEDKEEKPDYIGALLSEPTVKEGIAAMINGLASMIGGGTSPANGRITGTKDSNKMNVNQDSEQHQHQNANEEANIRVLVAAGKINQAIQPMGHHVVDVLEQLADLAESNPQKLKMALSFL